MFQHFVMTRFNLATPGKEESIRNQAGWLEHRFDLFERYCLPTVLSQTARDFRWIIYFDRDTPDIFKERIGRLSAGGAFVPYFTPLFPAEGWSRSLAETFDLREALVLTTTLDSDDAIAGDFVERLHAAVRRTGFAQGCYNFEYGLIRQRNALYRIRHRSNAFFSHVSPSGPSLRTAPSIHHMRIAEAGPVFQIGGEPAWMQIVHGRNVSNKIRGTRVADPGIAARFAGDAGRGIAPVSGAQAFLENATLGLLRSARDRAISAVRHLR